MKGKKIIQLFKEDIIKRQPDAADKIQFLAAEAQMKMFDIHARAMGCFCECLGMNAENAMAVCANQQAPYNAGHYQDVMEKWKLVDKKGEPLI